MASTKISALGAASALGGADLLPIVQGGATRKATGQQLIDLATTGLPRLPWQFAAHAPLTTGHAIFIDGDSKGVLMGQFGGQSALFWALTLNPLHVRFDPATSVMAVNGSYSNGSASGGTDAYGVATVLGLTNATRIARAVARIAAGDDICILQIGTNDIGSSASESAVLANVQKYHAALRAAGLRRLIIMAADTIYSASTDAAKGALRLSINRGLAQYAALNPDVRFVDTDPYEIDPLSAVGAMKGGYMGQPFVEAAFSATTDGCHESNYGGYLRGLALGAVLREMFPSRKPRTTSVADAFNAATATRGNLIGAAGYARGTGGTTSNLGGATAVNAANAANGWLFKYSGAGLTFDFGTADPPAAYLNGLGGRGDFTAKRVAISGTPTASGRLVMQPNGAVSVPVAGMAYEEEFLLHANALAGCFGIRSGLQTSVGIYQSGGFADTSSHQLPPLEGPLLVRRPAPFVPPGSPTSILPFFEMRFIAGTPVSGSIDLVSADLRQVPALPAPAA